MGVSGFHSMAFGMPGGEQCAPSKARPIDLVHLARQTMGDRNLESEILQLFLAHSMAVGERLRLADPHERKKLAHGLKGSARGIGAFGVAECAEALEENPSQASLIAELMQRLEAVREFVASISR